MCGVFGQNSRDALRHGLLLLQPCEINGKVRHNPTGLTLRGVSGRVLAYGSEGLRGLEGRYAQLVAALSDAQWPTPRWPVHVFTAGAMTCLLTSSFCHLFGCCDWHWTKVPCPNA